MPWTDKQVRLFAAAAHDPDIAQRTGIKPEKAHDMLMEAPAKQRSSAMSGPRQMEQARQLREGYQLGGQVEDDPRYSTPEAMLEYARTRQKGLPITADVLPRDEYGNPTEEQLKGSAGSAQYTRRQQQQQKFLGNQ